MQARPRMLPSGRPYSSRLRSGDMSPKVKLVPSRCPGKGLSLVQRGMRLAQHHIRHRGVFTCSEPPCSQLAVHAEGPGVILSTEPLDNAQLRLAEGCKLPPVSHGACRPVPPAVHTSESRRKHVREPVASASMPVLSCEDCKSSRRDTSMCSLSGTCSLSLSCSLCVTPRSARVCVCVLPVPLRRIPARPLPIGWRPWTAFRPSAAAALFIAFV